MDKIKYRNKVNGYQAQRGGIRYVIPLLIKKLPDWYLLAGEKKKTQHRVFSNELGMVPHSRERPMTRGSCSTKYNQWHVVGILCLILHCLDFLLPFLWFWFLFLSFYETECAYIFFVCLKEQWETEHKFGRYGGGEHLGGNGEAEKWSKYIMWKKNFSIKKSECLFCLLLRIC